MTPMTSWRQAQQKFYNKNYNNSNNMTKYHGL